jgi:hypothetical protein
MEETSGAALALLRKLICIRKNLMKLPVPLKF